MSTAEPPPLPPPDGPVRAEDRRACPATAVLHRLGDRWSVLLLSLLAERPYGYNELDRAVADLSRRMLTRCLRALEEEGYVSRTARGEAPYRVEYALTTLGRSLHEAVAHLAAAVGTAEALTPERAPAPGPRAA
ncbi:winged helix-turn-helix transcriptional regulator [Kitasatospora sp. NPDC101183]|uniref:winged helix-turn-helix transcriptional regulator n=1 Tax=Kitasatospora sp. NPDC101183 TaxID=3364100 RepID=UPI003825A4C6